MADSVNILALCAGVGMLECGVSAAIEYLGHRPRVLGFVERDAYAASVLMARMEEASLEPATVWCGNLEDMDAGNLRGHVDIITAGFPCQPWSAAGKQQGTDDERWLWPAIVRIIVDVEPEYVFLENVPGLVSGGGFEHVLSDLAKVGFDAEWCHLPAAAVGASHRRERVFILAHAGRHGGRQTTAREAGGRPDTDQRSGSLGDSRSVRRQAGNVALQRSGDKPPGGLPVSAGEGCGGVLGNARGAGLPLSEQPSVQRTGRREQRGATTESGGAYLFAPGPESTWWAEVEPFLLPAIEPGVCLLADGMALVLDASRADQLRCAGNGCVPAQAGAAFVGLMRRFEKS